MSPQEYGISTTYKTRVATQKPCREHLAIVIGQLKDRRVGIILSLVRSAASRCRPPDHDCAVVAVIGFAV
jgi:hypothetical protein